MPATATYRIGPSDFFTPGDLSADADTLNGQVEELDAQLDEGDPPVEFQDQWTHYQTSWATFYKAHFGGFFSSLFTALNDANRDDLIRYETQFGDFQRQAKAYGAELVAPVGPSSGSGDTIGRQLEAQGLPSTTTLVVLAAAVIAVLIAWKATT
jgi:hypothetical protein